MMTSWLKNEDARHRFASGEKAYPFEIRPQWSGRPEDSERPASDGRTLLEER
jgi:hypothetical protein